jgi:RNA polymerase sigma-70 factor (ECF subfamily)
MEAQTIMGDLYNRYAGGVRKHLARLVGDFELDDLMHDVFERAQRALGTHRSEARLSTWLYRIATYAAIDRLRSRSVRERNGAPEPIEGAEIAGDDIPADQALGRTRVRSCVRKLVDRLPANQKAVVVLVELRGMTDQEAAGALGITVPAAKIRLHRARLALRRMMTCECEVYHDERNELGCEPRPDVPPAAAH